MAAVIRSEPLTGFDTPLADRQSIDCFESLPEDASIADRFHATLEASEAFMAECDRIQMQHRLDMIARWGLPADHFTPGPANPTLPTIKDSM